MKEGLAREDLTAAQLPFLGVLRRRPPAPRRALEGWSPPRKALGVSTPLRLVI